VKQTLAQTFHLSTAGRELLGGVLGFVAFMIALGNTGRILDANTHEAPNSLSFTLACLLVIAALLLSVWIATQVAGERASPARRFVALCIVASSTITLLHNHEWASGWLAIIVLVSGCTLFLANAYLAHRTNRTEQSAE